jgi:ABC-type transport system involved in cytochrome c biogenesis permease component
MIKNQWYAVLESGKHNQAIYTIKLGRGQRQELVADLAEGLRWIATPIAMIIGRSREVIADTASRGIK